MAIDLTKINNTPFALLIWYLTEGHEDEARVYARIATWNPTLENVEIRGSESEAPMLLLNGSELDRIRVVTEDVKEIMLNCEYGIALSISDLHEDSAYGYEKVGLEW